MSTPSWLAIAQAQFQQGNLDAALTTLETGLTENPTCDDGWELKGRVLQALQRYGEAAEANQEAMQWMQAGVVSQGTAPYLVTAEDWFKRGNKSFDASDWDTALFAYDQALAIKPDKHEAWNNRGLTLADLGRDEDAIASYDQALAIQPDFHEAWNNRGLALAHLGRYEDAIANYDQALEIKPDLHDAWNSRGGALYYLGRYEDAIASYNRALEIKPDDHGAWNNRGLTLADLGRYEDAIASYDRALEIQPDLHEAWNNRGLALAHLGRYEDAIVSWDRALAIQPDDDKAWFNRGLALAHLGRYEDAIASYDRALEIQPDDHAAWYNRGFALYYLGHYEDAIASCDQALEIQPDDHEVWKNRATAVCNLSKDYRLSPRIALAIGESPLRSLLQQPEPHIAALKEAIPHLTPNSPAWAQIYLALGDTYLKHSNSKENVRPYWRDAVRSYETALSVLTAEAFPESHLEILQGLIRAYLALENILTARMYQQQGIRVFEQLRAKQPIQCKASFEAKFSGFSQLEIDLLVGENQPIAALEQAEFYKNRCLTWILDEWRETVLSPGYEEMQSLCSTDTAILYWHLSPDNLTTFVVQFGQDAPVVLECNSRQQAQQFETWRQEWDRDYRDYASKKIADSNEPSEAKARQNHPWRTSLKNRLAALKEILQIDLICSQLSDSVQNLILVPHRDLHRFPIHTLFHQPFICHYLPSIQIGLNQHKDDTPKSYAPLLNVDDPLLDMDDPQTKQTGMPYAQLESAIVRSLVQNAKHIAFNAASTETVLTELQTAYRTFHFTGHAAYNSRKPEDSALALTDGLLTAKHISHLDLSAYRLVCLSSCETAITGKDGITTEYVGLGSAFLKAGATNVLSTLWQVDEIASAWLMIQFYQGLLADASPAIALKQAQDWLRTVTWDKLADWIRQLSQLQDLEPGIVDLLQARANNTFKEGSTIGLNQVTKYAHPYYWAAVILKGPG